MEARDTLLTVCLKIVHQNSPWVLLCELFDSLINGSRLMTCCLLFSETGADPSWHQSSVRVCSSTFKSQPVKIVMRSASSVTVYTILSPVLFFQCPHEAMCPKLAVEHVTPCNFRQLYQPLPKPGVSSKSGLTLCVKHSIASYTRIQTMKILFITQSNLNTQTYIHVLF